MSSAPPGFDRQDAIILGLIKAVQALTAVTYHTSPKRDALEEQFKIYHEGTGTGLQGDLLKNYQAPIDGMLKIIAEIKDVQPKS